MGEIVELKMEVWGTPVLTGYSWKDLSRTSLSSRLQRNKEIGKKPKLESLKITFMTKNSILNTFKSNGLSIYTAWEAPELLKPIQFYQMPLSEDLQLNEKTWSQTRNRQKYQICWGYRLVYYLHVFQRFFRARKETWAKQQFFGCRPLFNIFEYRDHGSNFRTI